jgi:hypothetical protein
MDKVNKQELRRLAEAASHKEWRAGNAYGKAFILKYQIIADTDDGAYVLMEGNNNFPEHSVPNIAYVGAANPAAILFLLGELDIYEAYIKFERDQLRAELEQYRKDAERYRWLCDQPGFQLWLDGVLRDEGINSTGLDVDIDIDALMAKEGGVNG